MTALDVGTFFDRLDTWRHLPSYRLEMRADVFFGLFLPFALDDHLRWRGITIDPHVIPEFPLGQEGSKHSDKADFFAVSTDRKHAFLVELKTEQRAIRELPKPYLTRAVDRGLEAVLYEIRCMAKARKPYARKKYFHLLKAIAALDLMTLPPNLEVKTFDNPRGVFDCIESIDIPSKLPDMEVVYVVPNADPRIDCIDFERFARVVESRGETGRRFAASLEQWACVRAGERHADSREQSGSTGSAMP